MKKLTHKILPLSLASVMLSPIAIAELKHMDDETLAAVEGQAGLTIDIDMGVSVGEFMYKDAGSIVMQGIRMGGMNHCGDTGGGNAVGGSSSASGLCTAGDEVGTSFGANGVNKIVADGGDASGEFDSDGRGGGGGTTGLNNVRIKVDIAGGGAVDGQQIVGFQPGPTGPIPITIDTYDNLFYWAWGGVVSPTSGLCGENGGGPGYACAIQLKDGDLMLGGAASNLDIVARSFQAVDFGFEMDRFALQASDYVAGDDISNPLTGTETDTTTIYSNLKMEGYFGGFNLIIENDGNGFGATDSNGDGRIDQAESDAGLGYGDANSKIVINQFFEVTEMEYDFDLVGIRYEKMAIHNKRGNLDMFNIDQNDFINGANSQGFAQTNTKLYAVKDNVVKIDIGDSGAGPSFDARFVDGITFQNRLVADMDIGHMSFGDTNESIGSQHWTDMDIYTKLTFSAH